MNWERDCNVLPLSTAHFFVFMIGVSPTAFSNTSTIKKENIESENAVTANFLNNVHWLITDTENFDPWGFAQLVCIACNSFVKYFLPFNLFWYAFELIQFPDL